MTFWYWTAASPLTTTGKSGVERLLRAQAVFQFGKRHRIGVEEDLAVVVDR